MKKDNKTIGVTIRFFTNDLPDKVGKKKDATPFWTCGNVHLEANATKGIGTQKEMFHYFEDIPRAIKAVLSRAKLAAVEDIAYSVRAQKRHSKE
ncbi:MAG: hypothetical protein KBC69_00420 [Candidatus Magasanikbacteria bacterium]|nr:hypothetical protein [Candidatus Magasanikbacteria bacterium]